MNISDKKFVEFSEQVWDRNKELVAENRELKDIIKKLREELKETNARFNEVCDEQHDYISRLEEENHDLELANDCLREEVMDLTDRCDSIKDILDDDCEIDEFEELDLDDLLYDHKPPILGKTIVVEELENGINITIKIE